MNCTYLCFTRIFIQWSIRKLCIHKMATIDCFFGGDLIINMGDNINWFNPTTSLCLCQPWIWISNAICLYGLFVLNGWRREVIFFYLVFLAVKYCQKSLKWVDYIVLTIFCVSCGLEIIKDNHHINYIHIQKQKTHQNGAQWRESSNIFYDIDMFTWILLTIMTTDIRWFKGCIWI